MEVWKIFSFLNGWFVGSMLIFQSVKETIQIRPDGHFENKTNIADQPAQ